MTFNPHSACITARLVKEGETTEIKAYSRLTNRQPVARVVQDICASVGGRVVYFQGVRRDGSVGMVVPVADRRSTVFAQSTLARAVERLLMKFPSASVMGAGRTVFGLEVSSSDDDDVAPEEREGDPQSGPQSGPGDAPVYVCGIRNEF